MFYEVQAHLLFEDKDNADQFYRACIHFLDKTTILNPTKANVEPSQIRLLESNHDLNPNQPSRLIKEDSNTIAPT